MFFKEKQRSYRINVNNPVYCKMLTDDSAGVTYEPEIKSLGEAMQVQVTSQTASGEIFGNGIKVNKEDRLVGMTLAMDITKIPPASAAEILGHEVKDGVVIDNADDDAPYIAIGYQVDGTGKNKECVWLLKGKAQPINDSVQQRTTTINYSTQTLNVNFINRKFDENLRFYADSTHEDFTDEQADKWFLEPPIKPVFKRS
ncbi:major tail protein [Clostridium sp. HBUAS56010]|uniref:major tail protein n=1 Tax=Clostridium sp. HBUAS56010 TaxID=2571127 RepID=UPI00117893C8|nr:major tail protein [Clostridium sp. HBUAS56010]